MARSALSFRLQHFSLVRLALKRSVYVTKYHSFLHSCFGRAETETWSQAYDFKISPCTLRVWRMQWMSFTISKRYVFVRWKTDIPRSPWTEEMIKRFHFARPYRTTGAFPSSAKCQVKASPLLWVFFFIYVCKWTSEETLQRLPHLHKKTNTFTFDYCR